MTLARYVAKLKLMAESRDGDWEVATIEVPVKVRYERDACGAPHPNRELGTYYELRNEAADEIERLRAALDEVERLARGGNWEPLRFKAQAILKVVERASKKSPSEEGPGL